MNNDSKKNELVSIVFTTLNGAKLLEDAFKSIYNQDYSNVEIIISDDDRTSDNTEELIKNWENKLTIKRVLRSNYLLGAGRLIGARKANGKYLMHVDADMQLNPGVIKESISLINEGASAVYLPENVIGEGFWTKCKWLEKRCYRNDDSVTSPRFFLTSAYFKVGGHNPKLMLSEDKDIGLRFMDANMKIVHAKTPIIHNERQISLIKTFNNKFFWSQTGFAYLEERKAAAWKSVLLIFFRKAYFSNWKLLLRHPFLTVGMFILKFAELLGAALGGFGTKLGFIKQKSYKTVNCDSRKTTLDSEINYGNCLIATHSSDINGPPLNLRDFLLDKSKYLIQFSFPIKETDNNRPKYIVWENGKVIEEHSTSFMIKPHILNYAKDVWLTIVWALKLRKRYDIKIDYYFGCNNLLTLPGFLIRKKLGTKHQIFYSIDYAVKRFDSTFFSWLYKSLDAFAARNADYVWSNTNRTRNIRRKQGTNEDRNILVINGTIEPKVKKTIKRKEDTLYIEINTYLDESKGVQYMLDACEKLKGNFIFHIIGYGPSLETLKKQASKLKCKNSIVFFGRKDYSYIIERLGNYDLVIDLVNASEGYAHYGDPMKIRESLGATVPVLVSSVPEVAEFIRKNELGMIVEDPTDIDEIASLTQSLIDNPEKIENFKKNIGGIQYLITCDFVFTSALSKTLINKK